MRRASQGFTLIETMIVAAILGILLAIGIPHLRDYLVNNRIQAAAEVFSSAVMQAKAGAAQQNTHVELLLSSKGPADETTAVPANAAEAAVGWMVRRADRVAGAYIDGNQLSDDSRSGVTVTGLDVGNVVFNPLGGTTLTARVLPLTVARFDFASAVDGACRPAGPVRCLRVQVKATGASKVCVPSITQMTDPRACT